MITITEENIKPRPLSTNRDIWFEVFAKLYNQVNNQVWGELNTKIFSRNLSDRIYANNNQNTY
jgi:hypothetical protein